ncbi:cytidyltransferase [Chryseobacterium formosense]|uniref:Cytidyltransferase n=1 Tax=Chryseobacterium formosense TaxID=236814 RepID=A0A085Z4S5_9FLAO|nr:AAA family ATPase [Chryseobacterium formosense]KFE99438.1 cytidyltransferase [Chryseobacterium formosense]SFT52916.1 HTH-type transcriptional regulator, transcriptional repressor of NAD biosynthesis genes [Chryseobacterium formosense]
MKGFVFGKFYPFHIGHQKMIEFALEKGDVTVLVCAEENEKIDGNIRKQWIKDTFSENKNLNVKIFNYSEKDFPNSSVSDWEISKKWSEVFNEYFKEENFLVTSEEYGEMLSVIMDVDHFMFDENRESIQISASEIRENLFENWSYLPLSVQKYFALKVVFLGTESTGKTVMTNKLSEYFKANKVSEAGRDLIQNSKKFEFENLEKVYTEHANRIEKVDHKESFLTLIDTDVHITKSYAEFIFGRKLNVPEEIIEKNKADLYLYLTKDAEYIQDGTRLEFEERNLLDQSHRKVLVENKINFLEVSGTWEEREKMVIENIKKLILKRQMIFKV